jgi:hypothetical protein
VPILYAEIRTFILRRAKKHLNRYIFETLRPHIFDHARPSPDRLNAPKKLFHKNDFLIYSTQGAPRVRQLAGERIQCSTVIPEELAKVPSCLLYFPIAFFLNDRDEIFLSGKGTLARDFRPLVFFIK